MDYKVLMKLPHELIQAYLKKMSKEELKELIKEIESDIEKEKTEQV